MLHMKWLALHHCLWEWSSGEALGSLGQPLWFVLMFWFHNPNILRAVICSLFPFYSVILLLFFSRAKLSTERRSSFKWETEKGWRRRRRRETGRREFGWREPKTPKKVKQHKQNQRPSQCKLLHLRGKVRTCHVVRIRLSIRALFVQACAERKEGQFD